MIFTKTHFFLQIFERQTDRVIKEKRKRLLINFFLIYSPWFKLYPFITLFSFLIESSLLEFMYLFTSTSDSSVFYSLHRYRYRYCKPSRHICALLEMCFYTSNKVLLLLRVHFKFVCNTFFSLIRVSFLFFSFLFIPFIWLC